MAREPLGSRHGAIANDGDITIDAAAATTSTVEGESCPTAASEPRGIYSPRSLTRSAHARRCDAAKDFTSMTSKTASIRRGSRATAARAITAPLALSLALLAASASPVSAQQYRHDPPRVRFGVSGTGGGFVGATHGALGGIALRLGVQVNDIFAVYVQGQGLVGQFLPSPSEHVAGFAFHTLMFEVTLADVVQLGMGPALDFVWGCDGVYQPSCVGAGPYFGGDARIAFLVGGREPGRRSALQLSLDIHPTWFGDAATVSLLFGLGYELY